MINPAEQVCRETKGPKTHEWRRLKSAGEYAKKVPVVFHANECKWREPTGDLDKRQTRIRYGELRSRWLKKQHMIGFNSLKESVGK